MKKNLLIFLSLFYFNSLLGQSKLVWTVLAKSRVEIGNIDGTNKDTLFNFEGSTSGLAIHPFSNDIYFTNPSVGTIQKIAFGETDSELIVSDLDRPRQISIDPINDKLYWSDTGKDQILRTDLNGSNLDTIMEAIALNPYALYYDTSSQYLYFSRSGLIGKINTVTLISETIIMVPGLHEDIEVDVDNGKIYWSTRGNIEGKIQRCNLDGSQLEDIVIDLKSPYGIALDKDNGKIYWSDWGGSFPKSIQSSNLDGSNIEEVFTFSNYPPKALILVDDSILNNKEVITKNDFAVNLFPNPVTDYLTISFQNISDDSFIEIFDLQGRSIKSIQATSLVTKINMSDIREGLYLINITSDGKFITNKIIKK